MPEPRKGIVSLLGAAVALGLVWTTVPGVPLYDGVGFPDEPYRFVRQPPGYHATRPPTPAAGVAKAGGGRSAGVTVASAESGPQVQFYFAPGALTSAATTACFEVRADPQAPSAPPPGFRIDGNSYRVSVVARPPAPVTFHAGGGSWISMRATRPTTDKPTFLYQSAPDRPWQREETTQVGNDIYVTRLVGSGDYSLAFTTRPPARARVRDGGGPSPLVLVPAATLALLGAVIVWVRLTASRR
jgi:hypothetical protein